MRLTLGIALVLSATACSAKTPGDGMRRDSGGMDTGTPGVDSGAETCETSTECDDTFACTTDTCAVGNVCRHTPLDALCDTAMGERCFVGEGCRAGAATECSNDGECDDGIFCTGVETCVGPMGSGVCLPGRAVDCDDGNDCTTDSCNPSPAVDGCEYVAAAGCDAGVPPIDGGTICTTFESMHYPGTYSFRPSAVSACTGSATFNISEAMFSVSGGTLSVRLDRFTLTQTPAPTDGSFDVSFSDGCASFRLAGSFACMERWAATWTATFSGSCSFCGNQMSMVRGSRR